jgi:hypothetical protein
MPGLRRLPRTASQPTQDPGVAVEAIIFDWGGTLTPWHSVDHKALWHAVREGHFPAGQAAEATLATLRVFSVRRKRSATGTAWT